jgi:hypothetical protein
MEVSIEWLFGATEMTIEYFDHAPSGGPLSASRESGSELAGLSLPLSYGLLYGERAGQTIPVRKPWRRLVQAE